MHLPSVPARPGPGEAAVRRLPGPAARRRAAAVFLAVAAVLLAGLTLPAATPRASAASCGTANLALNKTASASSSENAAYYPASAAVDGNTGTRWSSAAADPQWLQVDLGSSQAICQVVLQWEAAYATAFQIQVSPDGSAWTPIYSTTTGTGGTQTLNVSGTGRYIRMYGTARATGYGYSLWEFQVYTGGSGSATGGGGGASCGTTDAALDHPATASSVQDSDTGLLPQRTAVDGSTVHPLGERVLRPAVVPGRPAAPACRSARWCSSGRTPTRPRSRSRSPPTTRTGRRSTPPPPAPAACRP